MASYTITITDTPDGGVHITGSVGLKDGGNKTNAGFITQAAMTFLTALNEPLTNPKGAPDES